MTFFPILSPLFSLSSPRDVIKRIDQSEFEGFEYINPLLLSAEESVWGRRDLFSHLCLSSPPLSQIYEQLPLGWRENKKLPALHEVRGHECENDTFFSSLWIPHNALHYFVTWGKLFGGGQHKKKDTGTFPKPGCWLSSRFLFVSPTTPPLCQQHGWLCHFKNRKRLHSVPAIVKQIWQSRPSHPWMEYDSSTTGTWSYVHFCFVNSFFFFFFLLVGGSAASSKIRMYNDEGKNDDTSYCVL